MKKLLVKFNNEVIAQTQGEDEELAIWLEGDKFKYPEGYEVEYIDLTEEVTAIKAKEAKKKAAKEALKNLDIEGANTIAKLKVIVKALIEAQE